MLAKSAQDALKGLCGGRELPRLFERLFTSQTGLDGQENDSILVLCDLCSYVLVNSEESVPDGQKMGAVR